MKAFWSWALHTFEAHQLPGHGFSSLPKFSHKNCLSHRTLLCLHNLLNRHRQGFHLPLIPHLCSPQLFNYSGAALVSSGHSFLLGLCCCPPLQHPHMEKCSCKSTIPDEQRIFESCGEPAFGLLCISSFSPVKSQHHLFTAALFI